jgi:hypothetical protein
VVSMTRSTVVMCVKVPGTAADTLRRQNQLRSS